MAETHSINELRLVLACFLGRDLCWSFTLFNLYHSALFLKKYFNLTLKKKFNVYFRERERAREQACKWGRGREGPRHRIPSRLQARSCQHGAWHGAWTQEPWDHDLSQSWMLNWLSRPGIPIQLPFNVTCTLLSFSFCECGLRPRIQISHLRVWLEWYCQCCLINGQLWGTWVALTLT